MLLYTMAMVPLIKGLSSKADTTQVWYADDSMVVGTIASIHICWESLIFHGMHNYGYYANKAKTQSIV